MGKGQQNSATVFGSPHKKIDFVFKIILIGQQNVGKSSILNQYVDKEFSENYMSTIGVDFRLKTIETKDNKIVKLQIWDTAGQERFAALTSSHYKGAQGCICVYDVTNIKSLTTAENYLNTSINTHGIDPNMLYLVANKTDLQNERKITTDQGIQLSKQYHTNYLETSAKQYENIDLLFDQLVENLVRAFTNPTTPTKIKQLATVKVNSNDLLQRDENQQIKQKEPSCCK